MIEYLKEQLVDTSSLNILEKTPTGYAIIYLDEKKENSIVIVGGANMDYSDDYLNN